MKCSSIDEVRENIDSIDSEIIRLMAERAEFVKQAASFKKNSTDVKAQDRVEAVIRKVRAKAEEYGLSPDLTEKVYRSMINGFIDIELDEYNKDRS